MPDPFYITVASLSGYYYATGSPPYYCTVTQHGGWLPGGWDSDSMASMSFLHVEPTIIGTILRDGDAYMVVDAFSFDWGGLLTVFFFGFLVAAFLSCFLGIVGWVFQRSGREMTSVLSEFDE